MKGDNLKSGGGEGKKWGIHWTSYPFLRGYYRLVFDALALSDIQTHMGALERNYYHEPVLKITHIPKNIASYLISGDQLLSDLGALARELNK